MCKRALKIVAVVAIAVVSVVAVALGVMSGGSLVDISGITSMGMAVGGALGIGGAGALVVDIIHTDRQAPLENDNRNLNAQVAQQQGQLAQAGVLPQPAQLAPPQPVQVANPQPAVPAPQPNPQSQSGNIIELRIRLAAAQAQNNAMEENNKKQKEFQAKTKQREEAALAEASAEKNMRIHLQQRLEEHDIPHDDIVSGGNVQLAQIPYARAQMLFGANHAAAANNQNVVNNPMVAAGLTQGSHTPPAKNPTL